jgi:hypothetical protein
MSLQSKLLMQTYMLLYCVRTHAYFELGIFDRVDLSHELPSLEIEFATMATSTHISPHVPFRNIEIQGLLLRTCAATRHTFGKGPETDICI